MRIRAAVTLCLLPHALGVGVWREARRQPDVRFTDVTEALGIDFTHRNSPTSNKYLIETMGGGVALLDYDNDGRLDIFFTNGAKLQDPMAEGQQPDKGESAFWDRLYRQNEDGTFASTGTTRRSSSRSGGHRGPFRDSRTSDRGRCSSRRSRWVRVPHTDVLILSFNRWRRMRSS
jgi:hypothetical protein